MTIKTMNNEIKGYINEASFISKGTRNKLIKLISKHFYVELPIENYLRIDISIKENGNIVMKDEEYKTANPVKDEKELLERYNNFKEEVTTLLDKREINIDTIKKKNDIINLILTIILTISIIIVILFSLHRILLRDFVGGLWILIVVLPLLTDKVRNRYIMAIRFIKSICKKK